MTIGADNLYEVVTLKLISNHLMKRIHWNYRTIVGFNAGLIALGVLGVLPPATSALLHGESIGQKMRKQKKSWIRNRLSMTEIPWRT